MDSKSIVTFVNITKEPFVGYWDREAFPIAAGESRMMELWRALHLAKHLVDRILNERRIPTNSQAERDELVKEIIKGAKPEAPAPVEPESVDTPEPAPAEEVKPVKKGKGKKEKEFEDLDNE